MQTLDKTLPLKNLNLSMTIVHWNEKGLNSEQPSLCFMQHSGILYGVENAYPVIQGRSQARLVG